MQPRNRNQQPRTGYRGYWADTNQTGVIDREISDDDVQRIPQADILESCRLR